MTLLELLNQDGIKTRRIGKTYRARCPFHNGKTTTSLSIDMEKGLYFCHGCGKAGDAIQWLRDFRGLSFQEVCLELGREPMTKHSPKMGTIVPKVRPLPSLKWQERAGAFLVRCQGSLKLDTVSNLDWLRGRGLRDETIQAAGLGWNPSDRYEDREAWGLEPVTDEKGKSKGLWLPAGLTIPLMEGGHVLRLRIRRTAGDPRYVIVSGSDMRPMICVQLVTNLVIVESELDGLLVSQEAGDLVGVVALGTATAKPDQELNELLKGASSILVSLDFDEAGAKASWGYWLSTHPQTRRWPTPTGKDPGDYYQNGGDIRAWILAGLSNEKPIECKQDDEAIEPFPKEWLERFDDMQLERLAIMTVDGRLSDQEALRFLN